MSQLVAHLSQYQYLQHIYFFFGRIQIKKYSLDISTVRPRDTRPQAARTQQVHVSEFGQKNLRLTNLCSKNLGQHVFYHFAFTLFVKKVARILSMSFFFPQKSCISRPYCNYYSDLLEHFDSTILFVIEPINISRK